MDEKNVVVGFPLGAGTLIIADYNGAEGGGVDVGFTEGGADLKIDRKYLEIELDQAIGVVNIFKVAERVTLKVGLPEATLANIAIAMGYPAAAVAGGIFSFGGTDDIVSKTIYLNTKAPNGGNRKIKFFKCVAIAGGSQKYVKNNMTVVDVEFLCLQDITKTADAQIGTITDTGSDTTAPVIALTTPAAGGTVTKNTKGTILLTITEANILNENSIVYGDTVSVVDIDNVAAPVLVAGSIAYDAAAKTITFTPTENWTAAHELQVIVTSGLCDNSGNRLAAPYIAAISVTA
jgi:hypothetical protein